MRIYIIGYMGTGKSTLGRRLAAKLNFFFYDIDEEIVNRTGLLITEIFSMKGELYFRRREKEILQSTINFENAVIATGGGTPCFNGNMEWMNRNGATIYLKSTEEELFNRLKRSNEKRPLIKDIPVTLLRNYIVCDLVKREKFYNQAQYIFNSDEPDEQIFGILK